MVQYTLLYSHHRARRSSATTCIINRNTIFVLFVSLAITRSFQPTQCISQYKHGQRLATLWLARENAQVRNIMQGINDRFSVNNTAKDGSKSYNTTMSNSTLHTAARFETTHQHAGFKKLRSYLYWNPTVSAKQVNKVVDCLLANFDNDYKLVSAVLQSSPRIVRRNCDTVIQPTIDFLRQLYGPILFTEAVYRNPDLLLTSGIGYDAGKLDMVQVYVERELKLSKSAITKLKQSSPFIFQLPMIQILAVVDLFSQTLHDIGYNDDKVVKTISSLLVKYPQLFALSVKDNLQPKLEYLKSVIQPDKSSTKDLAAVFQTSAAAVLTLSIDDSLKPKIEYLKQLLSKEELAKCIAAHPQILCLSMSNLQSKVQYFDGINVIDDKDELLHHQDRSKRLVSTSLASRILSRAPTVFGLSTESNIKPKIEFLSRIWGRDDDPSLHNNRNNNGNDIDESTSSGIVSSTTTHSLAKNLRDFPGILTLSLESNIKPTIRFYNQTGYIRLDSNWRLLTVDTAAADDNSATSSIPSISSSSSSSTTSSATDSTNTKRRIQSKQRLMMPGKFIASSLYSRLLPRWRYYYLSSQQTNAPTSSSMDDYPPISLHILAAYSDQRFCQSMKLNYDHYIRYKAEMTDRFKRDSQFANWAKLPLFSHTLQSTLY